MPEYFHANLPQALIEVEREFNRCREKHEDRLLDLLHACGAASVEVPEGYQTKELLVDEEPVNSRARKVPVALVNSRIAINLGGGYVMKVRPYGNVRLWGAKALYYTFFKPLQNRNQDYNIEEDNVRILRKYGFTAKNGFLVPEHKVVGIYFDEERIKVDANGYGITITEDLSNGGNCNVADFEPQLFTALQNGEALRRDYQRHAQALFDLYNNPKIKATVNRHGAPKYPKRFIDRMLLVVIKENIGELAIADLDNLIFDEAAED